MTYPRPTLALALAALACAGGAPARAGDAAPPRRVPADPLETPPPREATPAQLRALLAELGPTPAERLAEAELPQAAREELRRRTQGWLRHQLTGNHSWIRARERRALVAEYGLQSLPVLLDLLDGKAYWLRREAALGCVQLVAEHGERARWLLLRHEAPRRLLDLIGSGPQAERVGLRQDVERALRAITERDPLAALDLPERTWWTSTQIRRREALVARTWREELDVLERAWRAEEARRELRRAALQAALQAALAANAAEPS